ncbi:MAG: anhydro-N-acetylmuramic acid kinase [Bryobacterales bacterium]|nr:anhydro-N-acetylmuramic acid kinase [Bryobacterales bacterium]
MTARIEPSTCIRSPKLARRLREALDPALLWTSAEFGIDSDAKEAIAFAILACESFHGRPAYRPSATGALHPCVLGKVCRPPVRGRNRQQAGGA